MITPDTSIEELHSAGLISAMTMKVCKYARIEAFQQLLDNDIHTIRGVYRYGNQTIIELQNLITQYHQSVKAHFDDTQSKILACLPEQTKIRIGNTIQLMFSKLSVRCRNVFSKFNDVDNIAAIIYSDLTIDPLSFKNCGKKTSEEFNSFLNEVKNILNEAIQNSQVPQTAPTLAVPPTAKQHSKLAYLAPQEKARVEAIIKSMFEKLPIRCQNIFKEFNDIEILEDLVSSDKPFYPLSLHGCGIKTAADFNNFLNEVKPVLEDATAGIKLDTPPPRINKRAVLLADLSEKFPFLQQDECEEVADFTKQYGSPILYLLLKYITHNDGDKFEIHKKYYGFNSRRKRYTTSEIARIKRMSQERVRQIIRAGIAIPSGIDERAITKLHKSIGDVIAFDSSVWKEIREKNMLERERVDIPLLVCATSDQYAAIQIHEKDVCYLVKRALIENIRVRSVCNELLKTIQARRSVVEHLDILSFIKSAKRKYHRNVQQLCPIYSRFLSTFPNVTVIDDRHIILLPNAIDPMLAIESILSDKGNPMSAQEIFEEYNKLHPTQSIPSLAQLKSYLQRNNNIKPKGKRGIYVLSHWENQFTGSLVEYIEHVLQTCEEPVHIDDLLDFTQEEFPNTNKKSIYTLLTGSYGERFVAFEDNYFGLANHQYDNSKLKVKRNVQRKSFDERFDDYKNFVSLHKRIPFASGINDEEASLNRWMRNAQLGNIDLTIEQANRVNSFFDANSTLPQDGREYSFKKMCDQIKVIVAQTFALPSNKEHVSEYTWLRKHSRAYQTYTGNRRQYFEELQSFLKDYGFYL